MKFDKQKTVLILLVCTLAVIALKLMLGPQDNSAVQEMEKVGVNHLSAKIQTNPDSISVKSSSQENEINPKDFSREGFEKRRAEMDRRRDAELEKYFSLKTQEERNKYMDELIAERKKHMDERIEAAKKDPNQNAAFLPPNGNNGRPPQHSAQEMKNHIESTSPEKRAQMLQFMTEMHAREHASK